MNHSRAQRYTGRGLLIVLLVALLAAGVGLGIGVARGQVSDPDFWMACFRGPPISCDEAPVPTVTETVTVTTTTEPPPTTTEPPEGEVIDVAHNWTCRVSNIHLALLRVTQTPAGATGPDATPPNTDAVNFRDCVNVEIDRVEVFVTSADGLKFNIGSSDIQISSGWVRFRGKSPGPDGEWGTADDAHQDGIQPVNGGGQNTVIRDVVFSGMDTQGIITSGAANLLCDGCSFIAEHDGLEPPHPQVEDWPGCVGNLCDAGPATAAFLTEGTTGTLNTLFCIGPRFGRGVFADDEAVGWLDGRDMPEPGSGNEVATMTDPRCNAPG